MIDILVAIVVGALIGWIASKVMGTDSQQGAIANIIVGIVGSALGSWLFGSVLGFGGASAAGGFSIAGLVFGVLGAVVLIFILKLLKVFK
ncbi:MAG TPA: GlsB/YeaQ/YmgE family stress response membrane protein [Chitinolyticbacter sp.]|uniref:GlsB/YeaQ/YmgE family stress response membrane protein n=1 Tax=Chitinolyticbacter albus TaxID=2961951 RepID=UPI00210C6693|nr:GlsB/YeaQ/YmgE family stress response membrane protein [Chitinolyticbacter albus]HSC81083.1 GlsB/YeaQ/YmgE family stress response membrane protein [Chitinolyticbacter sp.]